MKMFVLSATTALLLGAHAFAAPGQAQRIEVDALGVHVVDAPAAPVISDSVFPQDLLWMYRNSFFAIPSTVAFSSIDRFGWVGQDLNGMRLQRFALPGDGTPTDPIISPAGSLTITAAAAGADLIAYCDGGYSSGLPVTLKVLGSADTEPRWTFAFPPEYTSVGYYNLAVSRDGSTIACGVVYYNNGFFQRLYFFNADGTQRGPSRDFTSQLSGLDLDDTGSRCITSSNIGHVIDTATNTDIFTAPSNANGHHRISGDGRTIVFGGFGLTVYKDSGSGFQFYMNNSLANHWSGAAMALSRDGNTLGACLYDYTNYLNTRTRIWDLPSQTMLGEYTTTGGGSVQDAVREGQISDDGSVFAWGSWGTGDNAHPEVMIFNRSAQLIGSIDTPGSVFAVDVSANGRFVLAGSKAVHANEFGNGGDVTAFDVGGGCPADFNGDNQIDFFDYLDFAQAFNDEDPTADFNGDNQIDFFDYLDFAQAFDEGCD
jgi:hypothetical protein